MPRTSERGAILLMVLIAIVVLMAFSAFVFDYGVLWVGRGQAQNAADAGALSGAVARAFDEANVVTPAPNGPTVQSINQVVDAHQVVGVSGVPLARTWSWACPPPPISTAGSNCVRVNVFRDGSNGSTRLPTFFANLIGVTEQNTRATATAHSAPANGSNCLKPWLIPDRWNENEPPATSFDPPGDTYTAPGWTTAHIGTQLTLKAGNPNQAIAPSGFFEMETATDYEESIAGCRLVKGIGDTVTMLPGNRVGPTNQGVDTLLANGPVTVVVGMFDPAVFEAQRRQSGTFPTTIVNMMGFRITHRNGNQIVGTIVSAPGEIIPGATGTAGGFLKLIQLIQ